MQLLNVQQGLEMEKIADFKQWEIDHLQHMPQNAVYLTADSETMLTEFDKNAVYVIGGLVDRNRYKGACH